MREDIDARVRARAFEFLREQTGLHGEVLPCAAALKPRPEFLAERYERFRKAS